MVDFQVRCVVTCTTEWSGTVTFFAGTVRANANCRDHVWVPKKGARDNLYRLRKFRGRRQALLSCSGIVTQRLRDINLKCGLNVVLYSFGDRSKATDLFPDRGPTACAHALLQRCSVASFDKARDWNLSLKPLDINDRDQVYASLSVATFQVNAAFGRLNVPDVLIELCESSVVPCEFLLVLPPYDFRAVRNRLEGTSQRKIKCDRIFRCWV